MTAQSVRRMLTVGLRLAELSAEWTPRELRHSSTTLTELVYRKELRPVITEGAVIMEQIFNTSPTDL